jgi:hypothetical protein
VLPDWEMGRADVRAVLTAGRAAKPAARAFVEFLVAELREISEGRGVPLLLRSPVNKGSTEENPKRPLNNRVKKARARGRRGATA